MDSCFDIELARVRFSARDYSEHMESLVLILPHVTVEPSPVLRIDDIVAEDSVTASQSAVLFF